MFSRSFICTLFLHTKSSGFIVVGVSGVEQKRFTAIKKSTLKIRIVKKICFLISQSQEVILQKHTHNKIHCTVCFMSSTFMYCENFAMLCRYL